MRKTLKTLTRSIIFQKRTLDKQFLQDFKDPKHFWNYSFVGECKDTTINQMLGYFDDIYIIKDAIIKHFTTMLLCLYYKNQKTLQQLCREELYQILRPQVDYLQRENINFDFYLPPYQYLQHKKNDVIVLCGKTLEEFYDTPKSEFQIQKVKSFWNDTNIYIHKDFCHKHYPFFIFDINCYFSYINIKRVFKQYDLIEEVDQRSHFEFSVHYVQSFCQYDDFFRGLTDLKTDQVGFISSQLFNCQKLKPKLLTYDFNQLLSKKNDNLNQINITNTKFNELTLFFFKLQL